MNTDNKMKTFKISAPAKFILFGEHAVVYGYPAIAVPVLDVRAYARLVLDDTIYEPYVEAQDLNIRAPVTMTDYPSEIKHIMDALKLVPSFGGFKLPERGWRLSIQSDIPISRGLGSSAAISVALVKALYYFSSASLSSHELIDISYELEKYHHGTPSGIDNTVISLERPVLFQRGKDIQPLDSRLFYFVIGDTGIGKSTARVVAEVARRHEIDRTKYRNLFEAIGKISRKGLQCLSEGDKYGLGQLMNDNQKFLQEIGVSSVELENLITTALDNGAIGAKLCGAGQGGCMVCVADDEHSANSIAVALKKNGAVQSFVSRLLVGN